MKNRESLDVRFRIVGLLDVTISRVREQNHTASPELTTVDGAFVEIDHTQEIDERSRIDSNAKMIVREG